MASLAVSLLACSPVSAGTYSGPVYSGGLTTDGTNFNPYTNGSPGWTGGIGGGCSAQGVVKTLGLSNSGKITAVFTWQPSYPGEVPPANVIVYQHCVARWGGGTYNSGGSVSGACDNGLQGPVVPSPPDPRGGVGASCESATYTVQPPSSDGSVTVTCSPSSSLTGSAGTGMAQGTCSVEYDTSLAPVILSLGGTTKDSSNQDNILIGQGCVPSMTAGGYTLSNYQWDPGGDTFDKFEVASDFSTGHVVLLGGDALSMPSPLWHYSKDSDGDTFTVKCSATATINGTTIGTVQGQRDVQVWVPYYLFKNTAGPVSVANRLDGLELYAGGAPVGGSGNGNWDPPGMANGGRVGTPDLFRSPGLGLWQFVQLATPGRWYYRMQLGTTFMDGYAYNGEYGLDNSYPYPAPAGAYTPPYPADSVDTSTPSTPTYWMQDSPGIGLDDGYYRYRIDESFDDYMMYEPPDAGYGSDWVPLHLFKWKWQADISQIGNGWAAGWTPSPPGYVSNISSVRCTLHPFWENLLLNSD